MKTKVIYLSSQDYPEGRIDTFDIKEEIGSCENFILFFVDLGFSLPDIKFEIESILESRDCGFFYLNSGLKFFYFQIKRKNILL